MMEERGFTFIKGERLRRQRKMRGFYILLFLLLSDQSKTEWKLRRSKKGRRYILLYMQGRRSFLTISWLFPYQPTKRSSYVFMLCRSCLKIQKHSDDCEPRVFFSTTPWTPNLLVFWRPYIYGEGKMRFKLVKRTGALQYYLETVKTSGA